MDVQFQETRVRFPIRRPFNLEFILQRIKSSSTFILPVKTDLRDTFEIFQGVQTRHETPSERFLGSRRHSNCPSQDVHRDPGSIQAEVKVIPSAPKPAVPRSYTVFTIFTDETHCDGRLRGFRRSRGVNKQSSRLPLITGSTLRSILLLEASRACVCIVQPRNLCPNLIIRICRISLARRGGGGG